jgi:EpsI family protein
VAETPRMNGLALPARSWTAISVTVSGAVLVALWPAYAAHIESTTQSIQAVHLSAPTVPGWRVIGPPALTFSPHYLHPRATVDQWYEKNGNAVGLFIAYYNNQNDDVKLVSSQNKLVTSLNKEWGAISSSPRPLDHDGFHVRANETILRNNKTQLLAWDWFWVGGRFINNPYLAKLLQAKTRLLGEGDDGAVIVLYAPSETKPELAHAAMREFLGAALPVIQKSLNDAHRS